MKLLLLSTFLLISIVNAKEYKAIFDCSSGDSQYISSRIALVEKTMNMIQANGDTTKFAITLHGECVAMVSKNYADITADEDLSQIKKAQETLIKLSQRRNIEIVACAMSLESNAIEKEETLPFIKISSNSFMDAIRYQNLGYALMTFK